MKQAGISQHFSDTNHLRMNQKGQKEIHIKDMKAEQLGMLIGQNVTVIIKERDSDCASSEMPNSYFLTKSNARLNSQMVQGLDNSDQYFKSIAVKSSDLLEVERRSDAFNRRSNIVNLGLIPNIRSRKKDSYKPLTCKIRSKEKAREVIYDNYTNASEKHAQKPNSYGDKTQKAQKNQTTLS